MILLPNLHKPENQMEKSTENGMEAKVVHVGFLLADTAVFCMAMSSHVLGSAACLAVDRMI